jgi:hypothetical protein
MADDRMDQFEKRLARMEHDLSTFHMAVAKKLTDALTLMQQQQRLREARVSQTLNQILEELNRIREKLTQVTPPVMN